MYVAITIYLIIRESFMPKIDQLITVAMIKKILNSYKAGGGVISSITRSSLLGGKLAPLLDALYQADKVIPENANPKSYIGLNHTVSILGSLIGLEGEIERVLNFFHSFSSKDKPGAYTADQILILELTNFLGFDLVYFLSKRNTQENVEKIVDRVMELRKKFKNNSEELRVCLLMFRVLALSLSDLKKLKKSNSSIATTLKELDKHAEVMIGFCLIYPGMMSLFNLDQLTYKECADLLNFQLEAVHRIVISDYESIKAKAENFEEVTAHESATQGAAMPVLTQQQSDRVSVQSLVAGNLDGPLNNPIVRFRAAAYRNQLAEEIPTSVIAMHKAL